MTANREQIEPVPATRRLAAYLVVLGSEQESPRRVTLPISKGQLASVLGTIPETLSRILARMASQGLLEVKGREIRIQDWEGLQALGSAERRLNRDGP